jgi:hypothetical protein
MPTNGDIGGGSGGANSGGSRGNRKPGKHARDKKKAEEAAEKARIAGRWVRGCEHRRFTVNSKSRSPPLYSNPSLPNHRNFTECQEPYFPHSLIGRQRNALRVYCFAVGFGSRDNHPIISPAPAKIGMNPQSTECVRTTGLSYSCYMSLVADCGSLG